MNKKVIKIEPNRQKIMKELNPQKRVCAYCRVSTDSTKQHSSYISQMDHYKSYINKKADWKFVGIFADEAKSGTQIKKRDEFIRMIKECEKGNIDIIITKSVTRFARNTINSIEVIRKLKALGVAVYFEKENINSLSEQSEQMLTILSSLAQGESENISTNVRWSIQKKFRDGSYNISCVAYGYKKDADGELIVTEREAEIVKRIFKEYLNGKGAYTIAKNLNKEKVETVRNAAKWDESVVRAILENPIYEGDLILQKTYTTDLLPFKRKHNKGEQIKYLIADNHKSIITREQAKLVQAICKFRTGELSEESTQKSKNRYEFSGKIICKECGGTCRRQKVYIGKPYESVQWNCKTHIENSSICKTKAIREDAIKTAYVIMWNKLSSNYNYILKPLLDSLKKLRLNSMQKHEIETIDNRIIELTEQSYILSTVVLKGYIDSAVFIERQNAINIKLENIKKKRNSLLDNNGFEKEIAGTEKLLEIIKYKPELIDEYDEKLFVQTVENVIIDGENQIIFKLINGLELSEQI